MRTRKYGQDGIVTGEITGEEIRRAYSPSLQFRDDPRPLHAIADGATNRRAGVGAEGDSEAADDQSKN